MEHFWEAEVSNAHDCRRPMLLGFAALVACWLCAAPALAHQGPPFAIAVDRPLAGYLVSVWADPDIGDAQFFVILETPEGGLPKDVPSVSLTVTPVDGRLAPVASRAEQLTLANQLEFEAKPYFDKQDMWNVAVQITPPGGATAELSLEVESTPPGYGAWDLVIYSFPFALLGAMWAIGMLRRRRAAKGLEPHQPESNKERTDV